MIFQFTFKKIISLLACISITISCLVIPASAVSPGTVIEGIGVIATLWDIGLDSYNIWQETHPDSDPSEYPGFNPGGSFSGAGGDRDAGRRGYEEYVSSLPGTVVCEDGSFLIPLTITGIDNNYPSDHSYANAMQWTASYSGNSYSASGVMYGSENSVYVRFAGISAPVAGFYTRITEFEGTNGAREQQITLKPNSTQHFNAGSSIFNDGSYIYVYGTSRDNSCVVHGSAWLMCEPDVPLGEDVFSSNSRPSSIVGDYGIMGDDGSIVKVEGGSLVNESEKLVYSPTTAGEITYTDCVFDYADRSYTLTLEDGSTMKVVYGDENVTIHEGDTVYNVYYLSSDSGSGGTGSGGSGNGGGVGDAVSGLLGGLGNILAGLIEGLLKMAAQAVEALGGLIDIFNGLVDMILGFFSGFTGFLGSMFPFLPEETFVILNFGLILLIAAAVIKKLFL